MIIVFFRLSRPNLVGFLLIDRSDEVPATVLLRPLLYKGTSGDSQPRESIQDPTLPSRRTGQTGGNLRGLEPVC